MKAYQIEWNVKPNNLLFLQMKSNRVLHILAAVASAILAIWSTWTFMQEKPFFMQILFFFSMLFIGFSSMLFVFWGSGKLALLRRKEPSERTLLTIDQNGIHGVSTYSSFHLKWNLIKEVKEIREILWIKAEKGVFLFIPQYCFYDHQEMKEIQSFIQEQLNKNVRTR